MMTVKAAAKRLGVSDSLVYELCACGALPHVRIGRPGSRGCIRISEADIEAYLAAQKVAGTVTPRASPQRQPRVFKHVVIPK
jgi:excisionase family DNA binding protein